MTEDASPQGAYFWQAIHGRLTSGMTAMDGGNACERQDAGVVPASRFFILREASQVNQSSTHSSTAFLARSCYPKAKDKKKQQLRSLA